MADLGANPLALTHDEEPSSRVAKRLTWAIEAKAKEIDRLKGTLAQLRMELANQVSQAAGIIANEAAYEEMVSILRALAEAAR